MGLGVDWAWAMSEDEIKDKAPFLAGRTVESQSHSLDFEY